MIAKTDTTSTPGGSLEQHVSFLWPQFKHDLHLWRELRAVGLVVGMHSKLTRVVVLLWGQCAGEEPHHLPRHQAIVVMMMAVFSSMHAEDHIVVVMTLLVRGEGRGSVASRIRGGHNG